MRTKNFIPLLLITSFAMMVVALYNGFGLTESDTGAYIEKGILNVIPNDRSIFYCWFIRYTSMWCSLWFTMFAQCTLLAYVLLRYIFTIQNSKLNTPYEDIQANTQDTNFRMTLFTVITITSFTCVAWVAGYLMPDVFAGILLLGTLLFLNDSSGKIMPLVTYSVIIFLSIIVHNSHFAVTALFSVTLIVWALVKKYTRLLKRGLVLLSLSALSWVLMCAINAGNGYGFVFSRGSHVFMVTKFAETGILKTYLEDNCGRKNLKLCNYIDQIPAYSWEFLWNEQSPLYKTGGWDSNKTEYDIIIHDVFTTPKYMRMFVQNAATGTLRQLSQIQAPAHTSIQGAWSSPWQRIGTYFGDELNEYCTAKQYTTGISGTDCNYIYYLFFILSSLWILYNSHILTRELYFFYGCILLFLFVNAFVTSTLSTVIYRFQNRVFWALPATNAIIMIRYYRSRFDIIGEGVAKEKFKK